MRELAKAGVMVGFCGGGGTPLFTANEVDFDVAWFSPQSEYRPTEYLQPLGAFLVRRWSATGSGQGHPARPTDAHRRTLDRQPRAFRSRLRSSPPSDSKPP
jgi:hypothetical protein